MGSNHREREGDCKFGRGSCLRRRRCGPVARQCGAPRKHCLRARVVYCNRCVATDWTVFSCKGNRDYVSSQNVGQFYRFPAYSAGHRTCAVRQRPRGSARNPAPAKLSSTGCVSSPDFPLLLRRRRQRSSRRSTSARSSIPSCGLAAFAMRIRWRPSCSIPVTAVTTSGARMRGERRKRLRSTVALTARKRIAACRIQSRNDAINRCPAFAGRARAFCEWFAQAQFSSAFISIRAVAARHRKLSARAGRSAFQRDRGKPCVFCGHESAPTANAQDEQNIALRRRRSGRGAGAYFRFSIVAFITRAFMFCETSGFRACCLEGGFLSHRDEGRRIATPQYRRQLGLAIAQAVQNYDAAVKLSFVWRDTRGGDSEPASARTFDHRTVARRHHARSCRPPFSLNQRR